MSAKRTRSYFARNRSGGVQSIQTLSLIAAAVILMAKARDVKFGWSRCVVCGERGQHAIGCPGRRGY